MVGRLGEGGASYGGFARSGSWADQHGWLRQFGGALSYLEDLGCAASNGAAVFARQQLSNFIGYEDGGRYVAYPAWWVAVLWKKLVGTVSPASLTIMPSRSLIIVRSLAESI